MEVISGETKEEVMDVKMEGVYETKMEIDPPNVVNPSEMEDDMKVEITTIYIDDSDSNTVIIPENLPEENSTKDVALQRDPISQATYVRKTDLLKPDKEALKTPINVSLNAGFPYLCALGCKETFSNFVKIKLHYMLFHSLDYCKACDIIFENLEEKESHLQKFHSVKTCEICKVNLSENDDLIEHYAKSHDAVSCLYCDLILYPKEYLQDHVKRAHFSIEDFVKTEKYDNIISFMSKWKYTCNVCCKTRTKAFSGHFCMYHKINVYVFYEILKEKNMDKEALLALKYSSNPQQNEDQRPRCKVCHKICTRNLVRFHHVFCELKLPCSFCTLLLSNEQELLDHINSEHKHFECTLGCAKQSFCTYRDLEIHYTSVHNKVYCIYCNNAVVTDISLLMQHFKVYHNFDMKDPSVLNKKLLKYEENVENVTCALCEINLNLEVHNLDMLIEHYLEHHSITMEQMLRRIGPNPLIAQVVDIKPHIEQDPLSEESPNNETKIVEANVTKPETTEGASEAALGGDRWKNYKFVHDIKNVQITCEFLADCDTLPVVDDACVLCGDSFETNSEWLQHILEVHNFGLKDILDNCVTCGENNSKVSDHLNHLSVKEEYNTCQLCDYNCKLGEPMREHIKIEHNNDVKMFPLAEYGTKCRFCEERFWYVKDLNFHENSEHYEENKDKFMACFWCSNTFSTYELLIKHPKIKCKKKFGAIGYVCKTCNLAFNNTEFLRRHLASKHPADVTIHCPLCEKPFAKRKLVLSHMRQFHESVDPLIGNTCEICGKTFTSRRSATLHKRHKHVKVFKCPLCPEMFYSASDRKLHVLQEHPNEHVYKCKECSKTFQSRSGLHRHVFLHQNNKLECPICNKIFALKDIFREHMLIHNGPKHQCTYCSKSFTQKSNLTRHTRQHTGVTPYACPYCPKKFSDKGACGAHTRVHTREGECHCKVCGKKFCNFQKLKYHMKVHTGEDLYTCEICEKKCTTKYYLNEHMALHKKNGEQKCPNCSKSFINERSLLYHKKFCDGGDPEVLKPYRCTECQVRFVRKHTARNHLERVHKIAADELDQHIEFTKKERKPRKTKQIEEEEESDEVSNDDMDPHTSAINYVKVEQNDSSSSESE